jgi:hypothetical protein
VCGGVLGFVVDTGANVNIIPYDLFCRLPNKPVLKPYFRASYSWGSSTPLNTAGAFTGRLCVNGRCIEAEILVIMGIGPCLLSCASSVALELIQFTNSLTDTKQYYMDKYPNVFAPGVG